MITRSTPLVFLWPTLATVGFLTLTACSSSTSGGAAGGTTTSTKTGTGAGSTTSTTMGTAGGSTTSTSSSTVTCPAGMTYGGGEMSVTGTKTVTAKIVDETGAPVSGQPTYICGLNICSDPGMTQSNGSASITTNLTETKPAFKVGDTINYTEIAIPLTTATTDLTMGGTVVINVGKLSNKPGAALTPGMDATSGDVTISVPAGASVGINPLVYSTPDQQMFRSVNIPIANEGPWLASAGVTGFQLLYGVAPSETTLCPAAKVTVTLPQPNTLGWNPGDAVEFWIMTTDTLQEYAPYAGWAKMSTGTVSTDGKSVSTDPTGGFIFLENFAIRKAQ